MTTERQTQTCPQCKAVIPVFEGYKTWCDKCGWNLELPKNQVDLTVYEKVMVSLNKKSGQHLFQDMLKAQMIPGRFSPARLLAYLIAGLVHGVTLTLFGFSLWLIFFAFPEARFLGVILGGVLFALLLLILLPRSKKTGGAPILRSQAPTLYHHVDQIAKVLNCPPVDIIHYDYDFNAFFGQSGLLRKRSLGLGLSLIAICDKEEMTAIISHELAHNVNGDPNRNLFLHSALYALNSWYQITYVPFDISGPGGIFIIITNFFRMLISGMTWLIALALAVLLWHDHQKAEYLADWLGARVSGTEAQLKTLVKVQLRETFMGVLRYAYLGQRMNEFFHLLRLRTEYIPEREMERIRRIEEQTGCQIYSTHPLTTHRIEVLRKHPIMKPQILLSDEEFDQIRRELEPFMQSTQNQLTRLDEITFRQVTGIY